MHRQTSAPGDATFASIHAQPRRGFPVVHWQDWIGPRLRQWLRDQLLFLFVGALVCLTLWVLRVWGPFPSIMVITFCIGNVLNVIMRYASRLYDGLDPPWNWIVYLPLLAGISFFGTVIAAGLITAINRFHTPYREMFRFTAPFGMLVSMTVGTVFYGVARVQLRLQERNQQLQSALDTGTVALREQEQELDRARQIQQGLLPSSIPQVRGMQVSGAWQPASAVGGDYYDVISLDGNRLAICIGDVVGKGITAALLMANLQAAFRAFATADASPAAVCSKLNAFMCGNIASGKFISFFYCIVDALDRSLAYENAGHCPAQLVRRSGETITLRGDGAVPGVLPDWSYHDSRLQLESGDRLVLFTDGVTEAEDAHGDEFGEERVIQSLHESAGRSAEDVRRKLMDSVTAFCRGQFRDDATIVVLVVQ